MKRTLLLILAAGMIVSTNGCTSMMAREDRKLGGVYPGVRAWPSYMKDAMGPTDPMNIFDAFKPITIPFLLTDLPETCVLDTMLLPADLLPKKSPEERTPSDPDSFMREHMRGTTR